MAFPINPSLVCDRRMMLVKKSGGAPCTTAIRRLVTDKRRVSRRPALLLADHPLATREISVSLTRCLEAERQTRMTALRKQTTLLAAAILSVLLHVSFFALLLFASTKRPIDTGSTCVEMDWCQLCDESSVPKASRPPKKPDDQQEKLKAQKVDARLVGPEFLLASTTNSAPEPASATAPSTGVTSSPADATTACFGVKATGSRIVYVIDSSASMGPRGTLTAACEEVLRSASSLSKESKFQVIVYNSQPRPLIPSKPYWMEPTQQILEESWQNMKRLRAEGRTEHRRALLRALALGPHTLFFVTDAESLTSQDVNAVVSANRKRCRMHVLHLGRNRQADSQLRWLAQRNGGSYKPVLLDSKSVY